MTPSAPSCFVSPSATLLGSVTISPLSSVWYGAVLRADVNPITIGSHSSIGDNATVHVAKIQGDFPTKIGSYVTVRAGAIIHAATVGDRTLVGEMAQVLDGSVVEGDSIILPGSVVTPGSKLPRGFVYGGKPAKSVRKLEESEIEELIVGAAREVAVMAGVHSLECAKDQSQIEEDALIRHDKSIRDPEHFQPDYVGGGKEHFDDVLGMGTPGRIFNNELTTPKGTEGRGWTGNKRNPA